MMAGYTTYGLDGEDHARLHGPDCLILGVMRDVGGGVEEIVSAVSSVCSNDSTSIRPGNGLSKPKVSS